jgi:hypothetical protein
MASFGGLSAPRIEHRTTSRRRRIFALIGALLAVVLVFVGVWAVFLRSDGSGEAAGPSGTRVEIEPGEVVTESAGESVPFPDDQRDLLVERVREYVEAATGKPLRTAEPASGLEEVFDLGALAAVQGPDGTVMLDQGLPEVTGKLIARSTPVAINVLADSEGAWVLASARIELDVKGGLDDDKSLRISRRGELVFTPEAGDWKITAYDIFVERKGPGVDDAKGATG